MVRSIKNLALLLLAVGLVSACGGGQKPAPQTKATYIAGSSPDQLSAWGVFDVQDNQLTLSEGVVPYDLNTPLFTDYAHKLRTIWVPDGQTAAYREADYPDFPVGSVISKTFYYSRAQNDPSEAFSGAVLIEEAVSGALEPGLQDLSGIRLVETRLLVRREAGWEALSYVWNDAQTDADLTRIGDTQAMTLVDHQGKEMDFVYIVPDKNQCAGCHALNNTTRALAPLGVRPRHINKAFAYPSGEMNQIEYLELMGYLNGVPARETIAQNADWTDERYSLEARARAYLDINCSHCHNPVGPADTSGLDLTITASQDQSLGLCKLPIAAGSGTGDRPFDIVPGHPDASILLYRMETTRPAAMMPELGRSTAHQEGVALIRDWIAHMEGGCPA